MPNEHDFARMSGDISIMIYVNVNAHTGRSSQSLQQTDHTPMHDPAECTPKLHFHLRVGGTPRPPFPPGSPGLVNKVQQGGRATGFVVCHLQTRVTRAQLESCTDLSYNLFFSSDVIIPFLPQEL